MKKGVSGIYRIDCKANNRVYVGSSICISRRWSEHKAMLRKGYHHSPYFQHSWIKYGEDNFTFSVIETVVTDKLIEREQHWMDTLSSTDKRKGFNVAPVAGAGYGRKHTEETKAKLRELAKGRYLGRKHSEESIQKMRDHANERNLNPEYLEKQRLSHLGKKHTPESKEKLRQSKLGKPAPNRGIPHSEQTLTKLKQSAKRGEDSHKALFKDEDIREIRRLADTGLSSQKIANVFGGCSRNTIRDIRSGKTWKHVV